MQAITQHEQAEALATYCFLQFSYSPNEFQFFRLLTLFLVTKAYCSLILQDTVRKFVSRIEMMVSGCNHSRVSLPLVLSEKLL